MSLEKFTGLVKNYKLKMQIFEESKYLKRAGAKEAQDRVCRLPERSNPAKYYHTLNFYKTTGSKILCQHLILHIETFHYK